ncbi:LOW QUALITY PROTEIN: hypothetical protein TMDG_01394, partial [Mycobacterium tuberculosis SUMu004]
GAPGRCCGQRPGARRAEPRAPAPGQPAGLAGGRRRGLVAGGAGLLGARR